MKGRSALFVWTTLALLRYVALAHLKAQSVTPITPEVPPQVIDDNAVPPKLLFPYAPVYESYNEIPFGTPCRICPDDIIQGARWKTADDLH